MFKYFEDKAPKILQNTNKILEFIGNRDKMDIESIVEKIKFGRG